MKCIYETKLASQCPVDETVTDIYDVIFESDRMIEVEDILSQIRAWGNRTEYQERITESLANELGCKVTLIGWHSNVKTTAVAP